MQQLNLAYQKLIYPKLVFLSRIPQFIRQYYTYRRMSNERVMLRDLYPCLSQEAHPVDRHYMVQDVWLIQKLMRLPEHHHASIGGRIDGFVSQWLATGHDLDYIDLNTPNTQIVNINYVKSDITNMSQIKSGTYDSVSCMHTLEHIGLGRYGDSINPIGWRVAFSELYRIVRFGGVIYISVPIGRERVCFNGCRVFDPLTIIKSAEISYGLLVSEFSGIDDDGTFRRCAHPHDYMDCEYGLGLYQLSKV